MCSFSSRGRALACDGGTTQSRIFIFILFSSIFSVTHHGCGHYQPIWFFIPTLIIGFFPWIVFLPQALAKSLPTSWKQRGAHPTELFFLLWALLIFLFFSFSKSKLIPYILPLYPPLAILTARYLVQKIQNKKIKGTKIGYFVLILLSVLMAIVFPHFINHTQLPNPAEAAAYLYPAVGIMLLGAFVSYLCTQTSSLCNCQHHSSHGYFYCSSLPRFLRLMRAPFTYRAILKPILKPQDEVVTVNQYYQDLPFYLERRISIVNWRNELSFGMQHQDTHEWMLSEGAFWDRWPASSAFL